jgi:hypothetical protein
MCFERRRWFNPISKLVEFVVAEVAAQQVSGFIC